MWDQRLPIIAAGLGFVITALPITIAVAQQLSQPNSFFYSRQIATGDLGLPMSAVVIDFAPTWVLSAVALLFLWREPTSQRRMWWFSALSGLLGATILLVFNADWGMNQEPYRFLPYGVLLLTATALPVVWEAWSSSRIWKATVIATIAFALSTVGTDVAFTQRVTYESIFKIAPATTSDLQAIATHTAGELTAYDTCFNPEVVKLAGGGRVLFYNSGFAIPPNQAAVDGVINAINSSQVPSVPLLQAAGVRWIVTYYGCSSLSISALSQELGTPYGLSSPADDLPNQGQYLLFPVPTPATGG